MKQLMELINLCFRQSTAWTISAIDETNRRWYSFNITYRSNLGFELEPPSNIPHYLLLEILWCSDLLSSPSEVLLDSWLDSTDPYHKVKAFALDTNLIIRGFFPNYFRRKRRHPYDPLSLIIVLPRSITFELHTMRTFKYKKLGSSGLLDFFNDILQDHPIISRLWNFKDEKNLANQIRQLHNNRGRIGLRGSFEVDTLRKWAPVLVVKPAHILHSTKVLDDTFFLNAVHDSLIRYEAEFFHQNISLPLLFLSNDKDQCKAAQQEGLDVIHVQHPSDNIIDFSTINQRLNATTIYKLILELLTRSPVIHLTSIDGHSHFLSWVWKSKNKDDIFEQKIRVVKDNDPTPFSIQP